MFINNHNNAVCTYNLTQYTSYLHINISQFLIYKNVGVKTNFTVPGITKKLKSAHAYEYS